MSMLSDNPVAKKLSDRAIAKNDRDFRREELKELLAANTGICFTYIRHREDVDGEVVPFQYGGAVICWRMPARPETTRMIEVSISWCKEDEKFDKVLGRSFALKAFLEGKRTMFRLSAGPASISSRLQEIFDVGFTY